MSVLIAVTGLSKVYENEGVSTPALTSATFSVTKGEFVAIMGPSGSGKSTLLHLLGLLDTPTGAIYRFEGKSVAEYTEPELARIRNQRLGFVFQAFNLLPRTTVFENVLLPLHYSDVLEHEWNKRATRAVLTVGLSHRLSHESGKLSGGEKQRVAIARALVLEPAVIFADEPTGNLDSVSGGLVMQTLTELNEKHGHTIILVTHETYTAKHARRILTLKDGAMD